MTAEWLHSAEVPPAIKRRGEIAMVGWLLFLAFSSVAEDALLTFPRDFLLASLTHGKRA